MRYGERAGKKKGAHGPCTIMCVLVFINRDTCTNAIDTVHVCVSFFFYVMRSRESKSFDKSTYQTVETKQKKKNVLKTEKKKTEGKKNVGGRNRSCRPLLEANHPPPF